jgi:hypothetical protein
MCTIHNWRFYRLFICILISGVCLYAYISNQNELTVLRLAIPSLAKELRSIQEENNRLKYEIESFESPIHLMELMRMPEFGGLRFAYTNETVILPLPDPIPGKDFEDLLAEEQP